MKNPLENLSSEPYFVSSPYRRDWNDPDPRKLVKSVNDNFARLKRLVHDKEVLTKALQLAGGSIKWLKIQVWVLGIIVLGEGAVIKWLATELFRRIH